MIYVRELDTDTLTSLLQRYDLQLQWVDQTEAIPGSFWGDSETGLIGHTLFVRSDTPAHSLLHEACHFICMSADRRNKLDTNAGGDYAEENAVCFLQILLAAFLPPLNPERIMTDMDAWGYSFRLGSARRWFEEDAEDARHWLVTHNIIDLSTNPTWHLRE